MRFLISEVPLYGLPADLEVEGLGVGQRHRCLAVVCQRGRQHSALGGYGLCSGSEAGSYLRLTDCCITQLKAQGPSRTCDESTAERRIWMHSGSEQISKSRVLGLASVTAVLLSSASEGKCNFRTTALHKCAVVPRRARILRLIDSCITQLKAQGPSRTCDEIKEERTGRAEGTTPFDGSQPPSSELGTYKTVKARFWPWL